MPKLSEPAACMRDRIPQEQTLVEKHVVTDALLAGKPVVDYSSENGKQSGMCVFTMTKANNPSQTYLRFLSLASAIRGLPTLDAVEERVLNGLAATWATGAKVTVLEAMELTADTSPTTVHRRLKSLRQKGLIQLREDETDSRVKYVEPTKAAQTYFAKLGQCLDRAARG